MVMPGVYQIGHSSIQVTVDLYGHLIPGGNKQAVDRLDLPVDQPRLWLNFATPAHPVLDAAQASEREGLGDQGVTRRRYGVSDGFRISSDPLDSQEDQALTDADRGKT